MGAEWRTGSMSAWLLKKKSGSSMVRVRQYNRRYFTIDFDSHVFFYSHAEGSKKVSSVIRFADIADVRLPDPSPEKGSDNRGSKIRRSFSFGNSTSKEGGEQAHHFVNVVVRPAKTMELLCASATEASQWFEAFKEAMIFGKDDGDDVGIDYAGGGTTEDETETTELRPVEQTAPPAGKPPVQPPAISSGGYPTPAATSAVKAQLPVASATLAATTAATPLLAARADAPEEEEGQEDEPEQAQTATVEIPRPAEAPKAIRETEPENSAAEATAPEMHAEPEPVASSFSKAKPEAVPDDIADDEEAAPPKTKGTFLDLSVEAGAVEEIGGSASAGATKHASEQDEIIETQGRIMQASDFGFGIDEDTESSGSAVSTPRAQDKSAFAGSGGLGSLPELAEQSPAGRNSADDDSDNATPGRLAASPAAERGSRSYGDRHEGLSMQERLANLEFSDCESDDDDPLGLGTAKGGAG